MIKKITTLTLFIWVFFIPSCFWYTEISNCYNLYNNCSAPSSSNSVWMFCRELENWEEFTYNWNTYKIDNNLNFLTYTWWEYNKLLRTWNKKTWLYDKVQNYLYRWNDQKLHIVETQYNYWSSLTFDSGWVCILETNNINELAQKCGFSSATNSYERENCTTCNINYYWDINEFYNTNWWFDKIYFLPWISMSNSIYDYGGRFCFIKWNTWYCLLTDLNENAQFTCTNYWSIQYQNSIYSNANYKLSDNLNNYYETPFSWQSWWQWITIRTWKNYYCPTFWQLLEMQPSNYNTWLCYNGTLKYENWQITTVQKQDIQTIFTDYQEYQQYIYLYNNYCTWPATQTTCENAFNGEREKYSIIANAINNNVDDKELWNYCNIRLNYDLNTTTCVASQSWYIAEKPTQQELIDYIENIWNIGEIITPTSGNILNSLIGSWDTREEIATRDLFWQLNQIKEKVSTIFNERNGINGIIPDYILWLILTTLLLTVLFKK